MIQEIKTQIKKIVDDFDSAIYLLAAVIIGLFIGAIITSIIYQIVLS